MLFTKTVCIIVDAFSTGKNIAPLLKAQGYSCIHIKSSEELPSKYKFDESNFIISLTYKNNLDEILTVLKPYRVKFCIPGYESGVELADLLSEKLGLPSNGSQYSQARRDKYLMNEVVTTAGLRTVQHFKSDSLVHLLEWVKDLGHYPIVLKPLDSANGDGVFFCKEEAEVERAFGEITSSKNQFGKQNNVVLAESLNVGQEYIINSVSWEGKHFVAEIWRVIRKPYTTIYEKAEIVNLDEEEWQPLVNYTFKVLDALHIRYGAGTTEVKYTQESGAVLLETSSRLMGNAPLAFSRELAGFTQLSLLIEAYLNPDDFLHRISRQRPLMTSHGMATILISEHEGTLKKNLANAFHQLITLHSYEINGEAGIKLLKTVNSLTSPGEIYLIGTKEAVTRDYEMIRGIERSLYQAALEPEPAAMYFQQTYPPSSVFQAVRSQ
jgi:biotin carboxylase